MYEIVGVAGIAISVAAYVPQVVHLWREHCSVGVSTRAWAMWVASGLLIGLVAIHRRDLVFILLQVSSLTSAAIILLLARRYRGLACETHAHSPDQLRAVADTGSPPTTHLHGAPRSIAETGEARLARSASSNENRGA